MMMILTLRVNISDPIMHCERLRWMLMVLMTNGSEDEREVDIVAWPNGTKEDNEVKTEVKKVLQMKSQRQESEWCQVKSGYVISIKPST